MKSFSFLRNGGFVVGRDDGRLASTGFTGHCGNGFGYRFIGWIRNGFCVGPRRGRRQR